ncbi:hypothetical protein [Methylovirgula ligni]|uniref:hypothetical protein n=1 Tax=Methylovirgula ligni TaxID=569860 RepID=UPI001011B7BB|nr:hypothetical protein [Methylovirgula ligni]
MHDDDVIVVVMVVVMMPIITVVDDDDMVRHGGQRCKSDSQNQHDRRDHFLQHQASPYGYVNRANPASSQVNIKNAALTATEHDFWAGRGKTGPRAKA